MEQDKKMRTKYRTTNWSEYNASLKARGSLDGVAGQRDAVVGPA
jgi:hypothetical protein